MSSIPGLNVSACSGTDVRVAIIHTQWNSRVVDALVDACQKTLTENGVTQIVIESVGGAFELPLAAAILAKSGRFDVIIPIGCLVKGDTMHFEYISGAAVDGLMRVGLDTGIPIINGILNVLTNDQALARPALIGKRENEAIGWAKTALQQVRLVKKYTV